MKLSTVQAAYEYLRITKNLQEHHLRVAAFLQIMIESWTGEPINQRDLILAGLFHDAANILKFKFDNQAMMGEDEASRIEYWRFVQKEVREKYGNDIHEATLKMCQEIDLATSVLTIIENLEWDRVNVLLSNQQWPSLLAIYADMRIGPFGILPLTDRINNLHSRIPFSNYDECMAAATHLESTLQEHMSIHVIAIKNPQLQALFPKLLSSSLS